jgi:HEAT repeat protein
MPAELLRFLSTWYVECGALILTFAAAHLTWRRLSTHGVEGALPREHQWESPRIFRNAARRDQIRLKFLLVGSILLFVAMFGSRAFRPAGWQIGPLALFYGLSLIVVSIPLLHAAANAGNLRYIVNNRRKPEVAVYERAGDVRGLLEAIWFTEYLVDEMTLLRTRWIVDEKAYMKPIESLLRMGRVLDLLGALQSRQDWAKYSVVLSCMHTYRAPGLFEGLYAALKLPQADLSAKALEILGMRAEGERQNYYELETLGRILGSHANSDVCAAARLLLKTRDPRAIGILGQHMPRLISILCDKNYQAPDIIEILGEIGDLRAIEPMVRLLHSNLKRRRVLAQSLLKLGWVPANDEEGAVYFVQNGMWDRCVQIGGPAITPLLQAIEGGWVYGELEHILDTLVRIGDQKAADTLVKRLQKGENDGVLRLVADAIRRLEPHGVDVLLESMSNGVRVTAAILEVMTPHAMECVPALIRALGIQRDAHEPLVALLVSAGQAAVEPLAAALSGPDVDLRRHAALSLGKIGDPRSLGPLFSALENCDSDLRAVVIEALKRIGPPADLVRKARYYVQLGDFKKASEVGPPAVEPLIAALGSPVAADRIKAAAMLGVIRDQRAVAPLIEVKLLAKGDAQLRAACVGALQQIPRPDDSTLRAAYFVAVGEWENAIEMGDKAVVPLTAAMTDPDARGRRAAVCALGKIGEQRALPSLRAAMQDPDVEVRTEAALILGKAGDQEAMKQLLALCNERISGWETASVTKTLNEIMRVLEKGGRADMREGIADLVFRRPDAFSRVEVPHLFGVLTERLRAIGLAFSPFETSRQVGWRDNDGYEVWLGYNTAPLEDAFKYLCSIDNPVAVNFLHRLAAFEGVRVPRGYSDKGNPGDVDPTSSLGIQQRARSELQRRSNPPYRPEAYLVEDYFR